MKIGVRVLGSSSAGNCTLVWDNKSAILVDCGFDPDYILKNLDSIGLSFSSLAGVLITHTHGDHVKKSMLRLLSRENIPVYCHHNIRGNLIYRYASSKRIYNHSLIRSFKDDEIAIGNFTVKGFEVPHDSMGGCYGYNLTSILKDKKMKITIATDIGYPEERLIDFFVDSDLIVIESNHDVEMLENSGRPAYLIQRIKEIGHISNKQCADMLRKILTRSKIIPAAIVLAHISQQCNTNQIAERNITEVLKTEGYDNVKLLMTYCSKPNEIFYLE